MRIGTHNSSSFKVDYSVNLFPSKSKWAVLRRLALLFGFMRRRIDQLTLNQNLNIYQQLCLGVNLLEFYVSVAPDGTFYCSHTFATIPLSVALDQINDYLSLYPQADLYVKIGPDFETSATLLDQEERLLRFVKTAVPSHAVTWFYKPIALNLPFAGYLDIQPMSALKIDWYNVDNADEFINKFDNTQYDYSQRNAGVGGTLTPRDGWNLLKDNLRALALSLNERLCDRIMARAPARRPFIVTFDFISLKEMEKLRAV